ncbi:MAG TPA: CRISPR-associated endonuclease Cas2 [Aquifex aeolicus]|nr:CRISPR-associated endonuclease Cas2 [Aquifex aeolicus]
MKVILVYDIATEDSKDQNRLNKVRKVVRKYLHHIQKSVFEGEISLSQLERLKIEVSSVIDKNRDSVIVYTFENPTQFKREFLTDIPDPTDNLI